MAHANFFACTGILFLAQLRHVLSQYNQYTKEIGDNGEDIWRSVSDFIPEYGRAFGEMTIDVYMSAEFDFIWHGRTFDPSDSTDLFENFFRVGFSGDIGANCEGHASRYPSFWITPPTEGDHMHVSVSDASSCSIGQKVDGYGELTTGVEYHVRIYFDQAQVSIGIGLTENFPFSFPEWSITHDRNSGGTADQWIGRTAQVWWMSNEYRLEAQPWYYFNRGNGTFRNIVIMSSNHTIVFPVPETSAVHPSSTDATVAISNTEADNGTDEKSPTRMNTDFLIPILIVAAIICFCVCALLLCCKFYRRSRKQHGGHVQKKERENVERPDDGTQLVQTSSMVQNNLAADGYQFQTIVNTDDDPVVPSSKGDSCGAVDHNPWTAGQGKPEFSNGGQQAPREQPWQPQQTNDGGRQLWQSQQWKPQQQKPQDEQWRAPQTSWDNDGEDQKPLHAQQQWQPPQNSPKKPQQEQWQQQSNLANNGGNQVNQQPQKTKPPPPKLPQKPQQEEWQPQQNAKPHQWKPQSNLANSGSNQVNQQPQKPHQPKSPQKPQQEQWQQSETQQWQQPQANWENSGSNQAKQQYQKPQSPQQQWHPQSNSLQKPQQQELQPQQHSEPQQWQQPQANWENSGGSNQQQPQKPQSPQQQWQAQSNSSSSSLQKPEPQQWQQPQSNWANPGGNQVNQQSQQQKSPQEQWQQQQQRSQNQHQPWKPPQNQPWKPHNNLNSPSLSAVPRLPRDTVYAAQNNASNLSLVPRLPRDTVVSVSKPPDTFALNGVGKALNGSKKKKPPPPPRPPRLNVGNNNNSQARSATVYSEGPGAYHNNNNDQIGEADATDEDSSEEQLFGTVKSQGQTQW